MLLEKDLKKLLSQLSGDDEGHISLAGSDITIRVFDNASKLSLTTPVYNGGNFIPVSVRKCVSQKSPFHDTSIKTNLSINENNYEVDLNYSGHLSGFNNILFKDLIEEFGWLAGEWKLFLDEHDKNDLVHIHVK